MNRAQNGTAPPSFFGGATSSRGSYGAKDDVPFAVRSGSGWCDLPREGAAGSPLSCDSQSAGSPLREALRQGLLMSKIPSADARHSAQGSPQGRRHQLDGGFDYAQNVDRKELSDFLDQATDMQHSSHVMKRALVKTVMQVRRERATTASLSQLRRELMEYADRCSSCVEASFHRRLVETVEQVKNDLAAYTVQCCSKTLATIRGELSDTTEVFRQELSVMASNVEKLDRNNRVADDSNLAAMSKIASVHEKLRESHEDLLGCTMQGHTPDAGIRSNQLSADVVATFSKEITGLRQKVSAVAQRCSRLEHDKSHSGSHADQFPAEFAGVQLVNRKLKVDVAGLAERIECLEADSSRISVADAASWRVERELVQKQISGLKENTALCDASITRLRIEFSEIQKEFSNLLQFLQCWGDHDSREVPLVMNNNERKTWTETQTKDISDNSGGECTQPFRDILLEIALEAAMEPPIEYARR